MYESSLFIHFNIKFNFHINKEFKKKNLKDKN